MESESGVALVLGEDIVVVALLVVDIDEIVVVAVAAVVVAVRLHERYELHSKQLATAQHGRVVSLDSLQKPTMRLHWADCVSDPK